MISQSSYSRTLQTSGSTARRRCGLGVLLGGCGALFGIGVAYADPLSSPSFSGSLVPNPDPFSVDAGLLGSVFIGGQLIGIGALQTHPTRAQGIGNNDGFADVSSAQIEFQTIHGPLQFYVQAGAYSLPSLGCSYLQATKATEQLFGPVSVAYAKGVITPELSVVAGILPTLVGAESTFTFQNVNIERGLLWNQELAISRGVQINYAHGPLSAAVSLNDGFYSGKLNWLSGTLTYAIDSSHSISFVGAGSLSRNDKSSMATPLMQNNSSIFNVIYTYSSGPLTLTPYLQYSHVGRDDQLGIDRPADTYAGALLVKYALNKEWSLGARAEYLKTTGGTCGADPGCTPTNLLYGANSDAWSLTVTPTYEKGVFFARAELSYVKVGNLEAGYGFGRDLNQRDQIRVLVETGILF